MMDFLGWDSLTPNEQLAGIYGGVITGGAFMAARVLFGGLRLRRAERKKKRGRTRRFSGPSPSRPRKRGVRAGSTQAKPTRRGRR